MKKYNWSDIQSSYDSGMSWRELEKFYGVTQQSIANARRRGDLVTTRNLSEATKLTYQNGRAASIPNKEFCENLSLQQSTQNRGGRCKWFLVSGVKVQGTWERNVAEKLNELNIKWEKIRTFPFVYIKDNKTHRYSPDFYLPDYNCYLEIKGFWFGEDRIKMDLVIDQNPDKKIVIIEKDKYERLLRGELVW